MNYNGDYNGGDGAEDVFVKAAVEVKRFLPSLFNIKVLGEKGSGFRPRGAIQDFNTLRRECLATGRLFEDPEFLADDSSLYFSRRPDRYIEWKRPMEIADNPQLFVEGFSRFDVQQGELGDCWLLAAVANLTMHSNLFFQVVPEDQSFEENYAGIFHFRSFFGPSSAWI
ncbi:calpain-B isoform X3 [Polyergus mexicanus]|uniref:calpain-B isoform X3 n=1 Tax=Polyergus mexicanus TaxID=615972 RepID=UPI0038B5B580